MIKRQANCSRKHTSMTPCVITDGNSAFDDAGKCVGCRHGKTWLEAEQATTADAICDQIVRDMGELIKNSREYIREYPAFRDRPVGAPGSAARAEQDLQIAIEDNLLKLIDNSEILVKEYFNARSAQRSA